MNLRMVFSLLIAAVIVQNTVNAVIKIRRFIAGFPLAVVLCIANKKARAWRARRGVLFGF